MYRWKELLEKYKTIWIKIEELKALQAYNDRYILKPKPKHMALNSTLTFVT